MAHFHPDHSSCGHGHHDHNHSLNTHRSEYDREAGRNILFALVLNLAFALIELVGGILTGSIAVLSDALHDFGDCLSLGLAWYLERLSVRGRDHQFSYGYKRFSLLSALLISTILLVGSILMIYTAVGKVIKPEAVDAGGVFWLAILGVAVNGYAAWRMMGNTSHSDKALRLHLMEDVLGWAAILVVSIVMYFVDLPILDPLLSIAISLWIIYNVYHNLKATLRILLQGVPEGFDAEGFEGEVMQLEGVKDVHDIHVWTMNGTEHIASLHIVHDRTICHSPKAVAELKNAVRHVAEHYGLEHLTIELDPEGESCGLECCCH